MSHASTILGIKDLEVDSVDRQGDIKVYARPKNRPDCIHCGGANLKIKATHRRTLKHTRQSESVTDLVSKNTKVLLSGLSQILPASFPGRTPSFSIHRGVQVRSL